MRALQQHDMQAVKLFRRALAAERVPWRSGTVMRSAPPTPGKNGQYIGGGGDGVEGIEANVSLKSTSSRCLKPRTTQRALNLATCPEECLFCPRTPAKAFVAMVWTEMEELRQVPASQTVDATWLV